MIDRESTPTQKTYGRGMVEGLKLAGVENPGDVMNNVRLKSMEAGLNGAFRKVYDVIPISGVISIPDIVGTLKARGQNVEHSMAKAAIGELIDKGLIRNVVDKYQRIAPKPVVVKDASTDEREAERQAQRQAEEAIAKAEVKDCNPIERMSKIEARIQCLVAELADVAKEVADTAIDAEMFVERIKQDNAKVSQLKELLKNL